MNELTIYQNIEKRLQQKREPVVFPLGAVHRKELRTLRDRNIGNLKQQLESLKQIKFSEFKEKHKQIILAKLNKSKSNIDNLNKDWKDRVAIAQKLVSERIEMEKSLDMTYFEINCDWDDFSQLKQLNHKREIRCDEIKVLEKVAKSMFEKQYGKQFTELYKKIQDITTKYEEAINFGDLEIVKELYYIMKNADHFFDKITEMKV